MNRVITFTNTKVDVTVLVAVSLNPPSRDWPYNSRENSICYSLYSGVKTVQIFSDRIRDRIRLEGFRSVRI